MLWKCETRWLMTHNVIFSPRIKTTSLLISYLLLPFQHPTRAFLHSESLVKTILISVISNKWFMAYSLAVKLSAGKHIRHCYIWQPWWRLSFQTGRSNLEALRSVYALFKTLSHICSSGLLFLASKTTRAQHCKIQFPLTQVLSWLHWQSPHCQEEMRKYTYVMWKNIL